MKNTVNRIEVAKKLIANNKASFKVDIHNGQVALMLAIKEGAWMISKYYAIELAPVAITKYMA